VVTRPREHASGLARLIEGAGGRALLFPAIEIEPLDCPALLEQYDLAIFVSPSAVQHAPAMPAGVVFAVGPGTRRELERRGVHAVAPAQGADSEALLALPALQDVAGKRIVIVRGQGGRELLGDTLAARGARVTYAQCYRRVRPAADARRLRQALARGEIHAVTISSAEGLDNLLDILGAADSGMREALAWVVPHARVAAHARARGLAQVLVAGPGDDEMLSRLVAYFDAS